MIIMQSEYGNGNFQSLSKKASKYMDLPPLENLLLVNLLRNPVARMELRRKCSG